VLAAIDAYEGNVTVWTFVGMVPEGRILGRVVDSIVIGTSEIGKASKAALEAAKNADQFVVSRKHLFGAKGRYNKFAKNVDHVKAIREALISDMATFRANTRPDSYVVMTDIGRTVGSKGESRVKVVIGKDGKIWTAYPIK